MADFRDRMRRAVWDIPLTGDELSRTLAIARRRERRRRVIAGTVALGIAVLGAIPLVLLYAGRDDQPSSLQAPSPTPTQGVSLASTVIANGIQVDPPDGWTVVQLGATTQDRLGEHWPLLQITDRDSGLHGTFSCASAVEGGLTLYVRRDIEEPTARSVPTPEWPVPLNTTAPLDAANAPGCGEGFLTQWTVGEDRYSAVLHGDPAADPAATEEMVSLFAGMRFDLAAYIDGIRHSRWANPSEPSYPTWNDPKIVLGTIQSADGPTSVELMRDPEGPGYQAMFQDYEPSGDRVGGDLMGGYGTGRRPIGIQRPFEFSDSCGATDEKVFGVVLDQADSVELRLENGVVVSAQMLRPPASEPAPFSVFFFEPDGSAPGRLVATDTAGREIASEDARTTTEVRDRWGDVVAEASTCDSFDVATPGTRFGSIDPGADNAARREERMMEGIRALARAPLFHVRPAYADWWAARPGADASDEELVSWFDSSPEPAEA